MESQEKNYTIKELVVGSSWKTNPDETSKEKTPFLQLDQPLTPSEAHKYLELLYDSDCPVDNDGYEIPRKPNTDANKNAIAVEEEKSDGQVGT